MRQLAPGFMGSLLLFGIACGGKVVVESSGATGAGGNGAGGTSTTSNGDGGFFASTGDVSPVGVVSSSTGGPNLCQQFCDNESSKGCSGSADCLASCDNAFSMFGNCNPQLTAVLQCFVATGTTTCANAGKCDGPLQAYQSCAGMTQMCTGMESCSGGSDGTCDCVTDCNGSKLEVQCQPGNATDFCVCFKDGMPIDKCTQPQGTGLSCSIEKGCCASSFFPVNSP